MKNISVKKDSHFKDITILVNEILEDNENIIGSCLIENATGRNTKIAVATFTGFGIAFCDVADHFKFIVTNKKVIFVGYAKSVDLVTGINIISYDEIKELAMDKKFRHIKLTLNNNSTFQLTTMDFEDRPEIIEKCKSNIDYIVSIIGSDKIKSTTFFTPGENVMVYGFSAICVIFAIYFIITNF